MTILPLDRVVTSLDTALDLDSKELLSLLAQYQILPQLERELTIDRAIADFTCNPAELEMAARELYDRVGIDTEEKLELWLSQSRMKRHDFIYSIARSVRIKKLKYGRWHSKIPDYFYQRKFELDRVVFSMIRVNDGDLAEELYFRLISQEADFGELAAVYSLGMEAKTRGINGPLELGDLDPSLAKILATSSPRQPLVPQSVGEDWLILQLESLIPAQLDRQMEERLLDELFEQWLRENNHQ